MNWNDKIKQNQTANEYLRVNYLTKTDKEIAIVLSELSGETVTKNAVRKARARLDLRKDNVQYERIQSDTIEITDNELVAKASASCVEELIDRLKIDTGVWKVKSFKTWQGFAKVEGEIRIVPLMSASFVRKEPVIVIPTIKTVKCEKQFEKSFECVDKKITTELVFSDPHFGGKRESIHSNNIIDFHDNRILNIVLEVAHKLQPDNIRILGDMLDLPEFSDKFLRSPEFAYLTQYAINEAFAFLRVLRETCPKSKIFVHSGNHDKRLEDMIVRHLPIAYGIHAADEIELQPQLSIPRLLALHKLNIEYTDTYPNDFCVSHNLLLEYGHGEVARSNPYDTVKAVVTNSDISKIVGHIHRIESASRTVWRGAKHIEIQAHSLGCTCKTDGSTPGKSKRQNWQHGFGVVYHTKHNFNVIPYLIRDYELITQWGVIRG